MRTLAFVMLCLGLSLMDIVYTYVNVRILKKHKSNWCEAEYNPFVRCSWHFFGFFRGTVFAALATLVAVGVLAYIIGDNEFFQGLLVGVFLMVHHVHYVNYAHIRKKYLNKEPPFLARIFMDW